MPFPDRISSLYALTQSKTCYSCCCCYWSHGGNWCDDDAKHSSGSIEKSLHSIHKRSDSKRGRVRFAGNQSQPVLSQWPKSDYWNGPSCFYHFPTRNDLYIESSYNQKFITRRGSWSLQCFLSFLSQFLQLSPCRWTCLSCRKGESPLHWQFLKLAHDWVAHSATSPISVEPRSWNYSQK